MPKVKKGNRILNVEDDRVESYLKQGYDEIGDSGEVLKHATGGKSVPVGEYNKLLKELEELKSGTSQEEIEVLKKENTALKGKITKLEKAAKEAE
ncbi:hypothetical protein [Halalkalibacter krulwichiae]|uniref:Uncharacterized protein n=1 Tax=Halalkalibacter krulwichiae TaxID=199441 RepID=A0A1X9MB50_9BACI|nr:hypothetical protein [Halalkalibacter krulwichiae]ARK28791.1 hypothetical protein BkAM31D_02395 [Halalkalibacter krulwichiae]